MSITNPETEIERETQLAERDGSEQDQRQPSLDYIARYLRTLQRENEALRERVALLEAV